MVSLGAKSDVAVGDVTGDGLADLIIGATDTTCLAQLK